MKVFIDASILIYLNVKTSFETSQLIDDLWIDLLRKHQLYTNIIAIDELIHISEKKYDVSPIDTMEFLDKAVLPYIEVIPIGLEEYLEAKKYIKQGLKPSDAIHAATIELHGLQAIATEDKDFDEIGIKRIWLNTHSTT